MSKIDKHERQRIVDKATSIPTNAFPFAVTWVDGRIIFEEHKKWSQAYFGICHCTGEVWALTPKDWEEATTITNIKVSPTDGWCERDGMCLNFTCPINKFDKDVFRSYFKDVGVFSLGMPQNIGRKTLWFNDGKYKKFFKGFMIQGDGGVLKFDENKWKGRSIIVPHG